MRNQNQKLWLALIAALAIATISFMAYGRIAQAINASAQYSEDAYILLTVEDKPYIPEDTEDKSEEFPEAEQQTPSQEDISEDKPDIETYDEDTEVIETPATQTQATDTPSKATFKAAGVISDNQFKYTWYSSDVLRHKDIGQWHIDENGYWRTDEGYLVVASSEYKYGTILESSIFGTMKILDSGCAPGIIDVYVNW